MHTSCNHISTCEVTLFVRTAPLTLAELHPRTNIRDYFGKVALLSFSWLSPQDTAQIAHRKFFLNLNLDGKTVQHINMVIFLSLFPFCQLLHLLNNTCACTFPGNFSRFIPFCRLLHLLNNTCAYLFPGQKDVSCSTTVRCL